MLVRGKMTENQSQRSRETLFYECFSRFLDCANERKSPNASHMFI